MVSRAEFLCLFSTYLFIVQSSAHFIPICSRPDLRHRSRSVRHGHQGLRSLAQIQGVGQLDITCDPYKYLYDPQPKYVLSSTPHTRLQYIDLSVRVCASTHPRRRACHQLTSTSPRVRLQDNIQQLNFLIQIITNRKLLVYRNTVACRQQLLCFTS